MERGKRMELKELKEKLLNKELVSLPLLFINKDATFLINTYIDEIAKQQNTQKIEVSSFTEIENLENEMFKEKEYLYVLNLTKDIKIDVEKIRNYKLIIIGENKGLENIDTVTFDKPLEWQIESYVQVLLPGLKEDEIKWLCKISKYDLNRLKNESDKISIFSKNDQEKVFKEINADNGYSDLNDLTIFNLSNSIMKKDVLGVKKVLSDLDNIDVEGTGLVTILIKNFFKILNIQTNRNCTPDTLGITPNQFNYLKYNQCGIYSEKELIDNYAFLHTIDFRLKSGLLDLSNKQLTYYIISNILK